VQVTTAQGSPVVSIRARRHLDFDWEDHAVVVGRTIVGWLDAGLEQIRAVDERPVVRLRRVSWSPVVWIDRFESVGEAFVTPAIVAAICIHLDDSGSGGAVPG
jgi:hypothetical protein